MTQPLPPSAQVLANYVASQLDLAEKEAEALVVERDQITSKIRFGLVALNGASLVALLGIANSPSQLAAALGFKPGIALFSFAVFGLGIVLAGISLSSHQNELILKSGWAKSRLTILRTAWTALIAPVRDDQNEEKVWEMIDAANEHAKNVIAPNLLAIHSQHWAFGCWLAGVTAPILASPSANSLLELVRAFC